MDSNLVKIQVNGQQREIPLGLTVSGLIEHLELNPNVVAVEVNLEIIPRESHDLHPVEEGDRLEIVSLVGGG